MGVLFRLVSVASVFLFLSANSYAQSANPFFVPPTYPGNGQTVTADFNGDGKPDLIFADGTVFDASTDLVDGVTPADGVRNSPIFQSAPWNSGPTQLGTTHGGDAILRANFRASTPLAGPKRCGQARP